MTQGSPVMKYLNQLIKLEEQNGRHPSKRVNWLKFCRVCGADISSRRKGIRLCERHENV